MRTSSNVSSLENIYLEREFELYGGLARFKKDEIGSSLLSSMQNCWRMFLNSYREDRGFGVLTEPQAGTLGVFEQYLQMISDITPKLTERIKSLEPEREILKNVIGKIFTPSKNLISKIQTDYNEGRRRNPVIYANKNEGPYKINEFEFIINKLSRCYDYLFLRFDESRMRYRLLVQKRRLRDFICNETIPQLDLFLKTWDTSFVDTRPTTYARIIGCVVDAYQPREEQILPNLRKRVKEETKKSRKHINQIFRNELLKVPVKGVERVILFENLKLPKEDSSESIQRLPSDILKARTDYERVSGYSQALENSIRDKQVELNCNPNLLKMRVDSRVIGEYKESLERLYSVNPSYRI